MTDIEPIKSKNQLMRSFEIIDEKYLRESRERLDKESDDNSKILDKLNNDTFTLNKDLLILAGTIFGSSIALATGKTVNLAFWFGELFLFFSIVFGIIILSTNIRAKEWDFSFSSKMSLESYLLLNKKRIDEFESKSIEDLIKDHKRILEKNQSGIMYELLKLISVEKWPLIFRTTFVMGILLILCSLIPR